MYLTQCVTDPASPRFAQIVTSSRSDAAWGKVQKLEITQDTLSTYAHPAISPDGEWLYFVSDMPGGMGGYDIWRVRITPSGLGGVENLGAPINTPGDEMFLPSVPMATSISAVTAISEWAVSTSTLPEQTKRPGSIR